jgi:histone-binding protein RBBP4
LFHPNALALTRAYSLFILSRCSPDTPYLYDFVMTHSQEWPSLTCQWLPTVKNVGSEVAEHQLLVGTHTTGEQNYLMVASCALPREGSETVVTDEQGKKQPPHYDEEKKEVGGFGLANSTVGKLEVRMKIKHEGEVNRARYMPSNHFIVASRGPSAEIYIFDLSKHPSFPTKESTFSPQGVCIGHSKEGYCMEWSKQRPGLLITGSDDATVQLWDVNAVTSNKSGPGTQIKPRSTFAGHSKTVEDVDWHSKDPNMFGSVGDDRIICIWDDRKSAAPTTTFKDAHDGDINSIAFNPVQEYLFATGSADKTVKLWDLRNLSKCTETFEGHSDQVYKVEWAPFNESILASCSDDRRIAIWDLSRYVRMELCL